MIARDRVQLLAYLPARLWHDSADRVQLLAYLPARLWQGSTDAQALYWPCEYDADAHVLTIWRNSTIFDNTARMQRLYGTRGCTGFHIKTLADA